MSSLRSSRRRRTLVAACLPYLLLSVFVNFVHLHPLLNESVPQISATQHVAACPTAKAYDSQCAICQWLRAGTGLKAVIAVGPAVLLMPGDVALTTAPPRGSPVRLSIDLRGPPFARFA